MGVAVRVRAQAKWLIVGICVLRKGHQGISIHLASQVASIS